MTCNRTRTYELEKTRNIRASGNVKLDGCHAIVTHSARSETVLLLSFSSSLPFSSSSIVGLPIVSGDLQIRCPHGYAVASHHGVGTTKSSVVRMCQMAKNVAD